MWFLGLVLFLLCVIERGKIRDSNNFEWFTIFALSAFIFLVKDPRSHLDAGSLVFEIISAYSGVGMSLGVPYVSPVLHSGHFTDNIPTGELLLLRRLHASFQAHHGTRHAPRSTPRSARRDRPRRHASLRVQESSGCSC